MIELRNVSYVRMGTRDLEGAEAFATGYLGLEVSERHKNAVYFKSDARAHTLCYFAGDPNDQAVAFEIASQAELEQAAAISKRSAAKSAMEAPKKPRCVRSQDSSPFAIRRETKSSWSSGLNSRPSDITACAMPASPGSRMSGSAPPTQRETKSSGRRFATPVCPIVLATRRFCGSMPCITR